MMDAEPRIEVWYGTHQRFGHRGLPQRWINILGRVYGPVQQLRYALNGGEPRRLSIGPDSRRLAALGDFNIDIAASELLTGHNIVEIFAAGADDQTVSVAVTVEFARGICPSPLTIRWGEVSQIQDVAQIVDGRWEIHDGYLSPFEISYDRLIALGDMTWRDYEVTVPIRVHGINAGCYPHPSVHAGVGIVMRWQGHSDWGGDELSSGQPRFGPSPYGAIGWYCVFHETGPELNFFDPRFNRSVITPRRLNLHAVYLFRVRAATLKDGSSEYSLKVWAAESAEPAAWDLVTRGAEASLSAGALLLGAHHVAASFGDVHVQPV